MTNRKTGTFSAMDAAAVALVIVVTAFALAPALARMGRSSAEAQCQSNMRRWSQAMALYLGDNGGVYPTNRPGGGPISSMVPLTPDGLTDRDGNSILCANGPNWVEALYPYLWRAATSTSEDWRSFRACPNGSTVTYPKTGNLSKTAYISYAFNFYLVEHQYSLVRDPGKLMMLRELDRRTAYSACRPSGPLDLSWGVPINTFLTTRDGMMNAATNPNLHGNGSYIAFADGHVGYFTTDYFPDNISLDTDQGSYWNSTTWGSKTFETIRITP